MMVGAKALASKVLVPCYRGYHRVISGARTVGAAAVITDPQLTRVVLVKSSYQSGWGLPGGFCARGEQPCVTAAREVREETGIELDFTGQIASATLDKNRPHVNFIFRGYSTAEARRPAGLLGRLEILDVRWFELTDRLGLKPGVRELIGIAGLKLEHNV